MASTHGKVAAVSVLIADDDPLVCAAITTLLGNGDCYLVAGEAHDGTQAVLKAKELLPDILLLDLNMPRKHGLEALRELSYQVPHMRTIVLTLAIERRQIVEALQLGARGVILKADALERLTASIQAVISGNYWVDDREVSDIGQVIEEIGSDRMDLLRESPKLALLSPKEAQIVAYVVEGRTNKDIAETLQTSEQVIKNHLGKIFDKLGVFNRLELALYAIDNRMVERR
jgi:two-component system, NarL family, nitrate/nitrite response regulator NarL